VAVSILIADASAVMRRIIEMTFAPEDLHVLAADEGNHALEQIRRDRPAVVLVDHALPGRNGYEIAAAMRAEPDLSAIPVILLAGAFEYVDDARVAESGCAAVLTKPIQPADLLARVRRLTGGGQIQQGGPADVGAVRPGQSGPAEAGPHVPSRDADDFFDRLDAALSTRASAAATPADFPRAAEGRAGQAPPIDVPTLEQVLGDGSPAKSRAADALADALQSLVDSEPRASVSGAGTGAAGSFDATVISEAMLDELAKRVLERLAPDNITPLVSQAVAQAAERLVREELERLRPTADPEG
jgi:CheY-like chemotaxis protein